MNKYKNKKVEYDGLIFDSRQELKRYQELKIDQEQGFISGLECQPTYELIPAQKRNIDGKQRVVERAITYTGDFRYKDKDGNVVVEDVKSWITKKKPEYIIKRKLMLWVHNISVKEVFMTKKGDK